MNKSIFISSFLIIVFIAFVAFVPPHLKTIYIKTSALCNMCKHTIETSFNSTKGVKQVSLDLASNTLTISYNSNKLTEQSIRAQLTSLGYNADSLQRDSIAFTKLPICCQTKIH